MSEYFVGSTGANNQTNFSSLDTSEVLDDLGLNTGDSPTFSGLFLEGSGSTIFSVDGSNGRLFGVTDEVTGTVFSVNDAAGLPIIEVESTSSYDKITLGEYGSDLLVLSGQNTIEITGSQIASQSWVGQQGFITSETDDQNLNQVLAEGNSSSYGISVNQITGTALTIDTDTLFVDSTNDRVGIGTTSPAEKLEVNGSIKVGPIKIQNSPAGRIGFNRNTADGAIYDSNYGAAQLQNNAAGQFEIQSYNSSGTYTGSLAIQLADGNVGIGTTSPAQRLHVSGGHILLDNNKQIRFKDSGATERTIIQLNSSNDLAIGGSYAGALTFMGGGSYTEQMRIHDNGNVGIGTAGPSYKLDVAGNAARIGNNLQTTTSLFLTATNTAGSPARAVQTVMAGYEGRGIGTFYTDTTYSGEEWFCGMNYSGNFDRWSVGYDPSGGQPEYFANAKFTVNSSGNVGIGTISPAKQLHVRGSAPFIRIEEDSASNKRLDLWVDPSTAIGYIGANQSAQQLSFQTANTDRIRITNAGNVGIGTTSFVDTRATGGLHLANATGIAFQSTSSNTNSRAWRIRNDDLADWGSLNFAVGTTNSDFADAATDVVMTMLRSGNVGIGTTSPDEKLHVAGLEDGTPVKIQAAALNTVNGGAYSNYQELKFVADSSDNIPAGIRHLGNTWLSSDSALSFWTSQHGGSYAERMRIDGDGNVGIGTTSPDAKLQVYSTATSNIFISGHGTSAQNNWAGEHAFFVNAGNGIIVGKANANNDTNRLYTFYNDAQGNAEQYIYNTSNVATIKLDSAGDTYFNGGNVGIGDTTPSYKLDVAGDIRATGDLRADDDVFIAGDVLRFTNDAASAYIQSADALILEADYDADDTGGKPITFKTAGTTKMTIAGGGDVTINNGLIVSGDLTVNGTTSTINSTTVQVDDKNIELGTVASPTDTTADGGGITLKGATDKTINWVNSTDAWTFSERVSIPAGSASAPSLTFAGDEDTGIYRSAANRIGFSAGGSQRAYIDANGITAQGNVYASADFRNYSNVWKASTGLTGNGFEFNNSVDGTALTISSTGDTVASGKITSGNDIVNATAGVYTWVGDTDTYIQRSAGNEITIKTGASNALVLDSSQNATFAGDLSADNITSTSNGGSASIYINSTRPTLGFTDSNSFTDPNDIYIVRAGGNDLKFQWYDDTASSTTDTFSIDNSGNATFGGNLTVNSTITTPTDTNLSLSPNGSGHIYLGDSGNGMNLYHYSNANDGKYTGYDFNGNYYRISTTATSGIKFEDHVTSTGSLTAANLSLSSLSAQTSELTALMINGSNVVGTRELGSAAFSAATDFATAAQGTSAENALPLAGGTMTGSLQVSVGGAVGINIKQDTGSSAISGRLFFSNSTAGQGVSIYNGGDKMMFQTGATFNSSTGSTRMTIRSTGNVGIGTTGPEDKLDIVGYLRISDNKTANTNKTNRIRGEHYDIAQEPTTLMFMNNFSTVNALHIGGGSTIENAATSLKFYTAANNTTTAGTLALTIDSSQNIDAVGSVTAYSFIKDGGANSEFLKADGSVDSNTYLTTGSASSTYLPLTGGDLSGDIEFTGAANAYVGIQGETDVNLKIGTGAGAEPRIYLYGSDNGQSNAGDVFIGTADNSGVVTINGAVSIAGSVTATSLIKSGGSSVEFLKADGSTDSTSYLSLAGGTIDGSLIIDTDTGSQPFYVTRSGGLDQSLKIYISDENAVFESIQDETADNHGGFIFNMDAGTTHPFFDVRKNNSTIMRVDGSGNVGIGTTTPSAKLEVNGHFAATTKSFIIDNPETGGKLQYGVVESDQHSVLVRGKNDTETIELPEEWEWLVDGDSVTVDLTSIGQIQQLFVVSQDNKTIKIGGLATNGKYNYTVYGERKDVEKLEVNI